MAEAGLLGETADLVPDALLVIRLDGTVLEHNKAATRLAPGMRTGVSLFQLVTDTAESVRQSLRLWSRSGQPVMGALTFHGPNGPVNCRCLGRRARRAPGHDRPGTGAVAVELHASVQRVAGQSALITDRFAALHREVSYRQRIAAERERLLAAEQRMRDRMQRLNRLSTALASSTTLEEVTEVVGREAAASLEGVTAVLGLFPAQFSEPWRRPETTTWHDLDADPAGMLATAARADGPTLITRPARPLAPFSPAAARHAHVAYCIPLALREQRLGVLAIALPHSPPTTPGEHEYAISIAAQVAQAVGRARLFEHEHHLAEWLQRSLLPTLPAVPSLSVATRYLPSTESVRVGGDWYDLFELGPNDVGLAIGDVAGHSLAEATVMAQLQNALRAIAMEHREPGETLRRLNMFTYALLPATLATACYLWLDTRTGTLRFASAGHPPGLLMPADSAPRLLRVDNGPALGAIPDARYRQASVQLANADTLLLYTDGLVEQRGEPLDTGLDRLLATARQAACLDPEEICDVLLQGHPGAYWGDDRALLAARWSRPSAPEGLDIAPLGSGRLASGLPARGQASVSSSAGR